ncbi:MAG: DUF4062 domain-containing protein [Thermodesulfovibrionales bacterium]
MTENATQHKRKYKVFISSSFKDLEEARLQLMLKTLKLGHIPAGMELFQPGEERNLDVIEKEIASSDIFVILVAARLGTPISGNSKKERKKKDGLTFTMKEYEIAQQHGLPVIAFLLNETEYEAERDSIPSKNISERNEEDLLRKFREDVQVKKDGGKRIVGFFSHKNIHKLRDDYADALNKAVDDLTENGSSSGWVNGKLFDELRARITLGGSVSNNPFFQRFAKRLSTFDKLSQRTQIESALKIGIAEYFWEQYMPRIDEKGITHIYFESGSSIAYVSKRFIDYVKEEDWFYEKNLHKKIRIRTNNFMTYIDFLLVDAPWKPMDIRLQPHGPFSNDYGATYGILKSARKIKPPSDENERTALPDDAKKVVRQMIHDLGEAFAKAGLILMATSGVDLNSTSLFFGPHVGSYYNMLLKRSLLSLPCPKVLFLDETKWGFDFILNNCHPICDNDFTWDSVRQDTPLAIAIAAHDKHIRDQLCKSLHQYGFHAQECGEVKQGVKGVWPIIAGNDKFAAYFRQYKRKLLTGANG